MSSFARALASLTDEKGDLWSMALKNREPRRAIAAENAERRGKRSDAQQLARLEETGHGHCREAEKLRKQLAPKESEESE